MNFQAQFPWPEEVLRANRRPSAFHAPTPFVYYGVIQRQYPSLPRPPWRNQTFRPIEPDIACEEDISPISATTPLQEPQPSPTLYRTKIHLWLPSMLPFHHSSAGKLYSYKSAFLILLYHVQTCDPSAIILPNLVGCSKLTELANPPIGPDTAPGELPRSLDQCSRLLRGLNPHPDGSNTGCEIVLEHRLVVPSLLALLNCPDKHNRQFIFKAEDLQDCSCHQELTDQAALDRMLPAPTGHQEQQAIEEPVELNRTTRVLSSFTGPKTRPQQFIMLASSVPQLLSYQATAVRFLLQNSRSQSKQMHPPFHPRGEVTAKPSVQRLWTDLPNLQPKILIPTRLWASATSHPSSLHSATKPLLRWLLAMLERQWCTSWDMVLSGSLWWMLA